MGGQGGQLPPLTPLPSPLLYIIWKTECLFCLRVHVSDFLLLLLFFTSTDCIVYETWTVILKVNSNQKMIFYCFQFSVFSKINSIQMHIELNWDLKKLTQSIRLYWVYTPIDLYTRKFTQLCTQYGQIRYVTKSKFSFG